MFREQRPSLDKINKWRIFMAEGTGLGLEEFLDGKSHGEEAPVEKTEEQAPSETPVEEKTEDTKTEVSPEGEQPEIVKQESDAPEKSDVKTEEKKEEVTPEAPKTDWEADDNTYKKRFRDTSAWANKVNQENRQLKQAQADMQKQFDVLNKKIDGTYDPEKDAITGPTPEQIAEQSVTAGKTVASRHAAYEALGQEKVDGELKEFHALFNEDELVQSRVIRSDSPIFEALQVMKEHRFISKYGRDPEQIRSKMREEILAEEEPKIREKVRTELLANIDKKEKTPSPISSVRGSGLSKTESKNISEGSPSSLKNIFGK
jgi:hypothetical protein